MTTAQLSVLAKVGSGSPTSLIAAIPSAGTTSYTATGPTQVTLNTATSGAAVQVNGVTMNNIGQIMFNLGNGQSVTFTTASGGYLVSVRKID